MSESFSVVVPLDTSVGTVSAGVHRARVISVKKEQNKAKTGDNLVFEFEILTPGEEGRKLRLWQSLLPQVAFKYMQVFAAFGIDMNGKDAKITDQSFLKKTVRIQVVHTDDQGVTRANIENVLADDQPARVATRTSEQAQSLDQGLDDFPPEEDDLTF